MNSEFQVLRWGIPGWIFFTTYLTLEFSQYKYDYLLLLTALKDINVMAFAGIAALFIALGVPIGYILYQVYFWIKWSTPFGFYTNDIYLVIKDIPHMKNKMTNKRGVDWGLIEEYVDRVITVISEKKEVNYDDIIRRYNQYSARTSRVHGLGSILVGTPVAFIAFMSINFGNISYDMFFLITLGLIVIIYIFLFKNYCELNKRSFLHLNAIIRDILNADDKITKEV